MNKVRVRYAPSPTGHLHIGNARTALFNYLFAKHYQGDFILRIEDTDIARNIVGGEESQIEFLNWLGIVIDESPMKPNPKYGPYRQMERLEIYKKYADILLQQGLAYKCFCTSEEIEEDYQQQTDSGISSTRYNRKCLGLSKEKIAENEKAKLPYSIRLKVPTNKNYSFNDIIRGNIEFNSKDIGDFVLIKSNGIPTYNFAVVIDDYLMEISHVFRGEEHLSNTPKQLMIYEMLGFTPPKFGHLTIIVNENHKKLSKRDNSIMQYMSQYKEAGYLPEAMCNFLALLGWCPSDNQEIFTISELISSFDENRLSKSPSMFDKAKLSWVNNRYVKALNETQYYDLVKPFLTKKYNLTQVDDSYIRRIINLFKDQLSYGEEIIELAKPIIQGYNRNDLALEELETINNSEISKIAKSMLDSFTNLKELNVPLVKDIIKKIQVETNIKGKALFMPLRIALIGQMHGPDFSGLIEAIGLEEVKNRLSQWVEG